MSDQTASTPDAAASTPTGRRRRGWGAFFRDLLVIVVIALLVSFLVKTFVVRSFYIPSASMENTLMVKDRILVDELTPRFGSYERGDVVVFRDPGGWLDAQPAAQAGSPISEGVDWVLSLFGLAAPDSDDHLIKRVIGVEGDHVVCCNALGQTTVNDVPIDESYVRLAPGATAPSPVPYDVTVPEDSLWVLGDNRNSSRDSRYNQDQPTKGFVPVENVVGRAFVITWPFDRFGLIDFHHEVFAGVPAPAAK
ncbi:signal peptidase I [Microbacterium testaceum]|uniref:Signal peptidase I n=1 Tax=Microbacterium testaceum TaxID=2033 RepID=A0A2T7W9R9_MICTE|nr:signal peptidase I [Microbacterium testaceum]PVE67907.1 signal peptidase I [Microbacterium testaceum]